MSFSSSQPGASGSSRSDDELRAVVDQLSVDELAALLGGSDVWHTAAIERLSIPQIRVTDGPAGARGTSFTGKASVNVPCGTALAATFDTALVEQIGHLLGIETRSKGARVLLAPTINLHRTPIGGRNFECMSEDPHLTGQTAAAVVRGLQAEGVAACVKHFVGNDTEFERMTIDSQIDEASMHEMYLAPFETVVKEAGAKAIMTGYNRLNGEFCADSRWLITELLRDRWGFDGIVMSDWFGLHSTVEGIRSGLDLEMPGPPIHRGRKLAAAVRDGQLSIDELRPAAFRMLRFLDWTGAFDDGEPGPETTRDEPADRALLRSAAAASMVLLRNENNALPIPAGTLGKVAVIGPNALPGQIMGGGSAFVNAVHWSSPLRAIEAAMGDRATIGYARGCLTHRQLPHPSRDVLGDIRFDLWADGLRAYQNGEPPTHSEPGQGLKVMWMADPAPNVPVEGFGAVVSTTFTPDVTGTWTFGVSAVGDSRVLIDGEVVVNDAGGKAGGSYFGLGKFEHTGTVELTAGRSYDLLVEYQRTEMGLFGAFNVGALAPVTVDLIDEAVELASKSDISIVIVGTNDDWESEGYDRTTMDLPGEQDHLISEVAKVSKQTIVVINAGSPVTMPWLHQVDAVVYAWFPGQEFGDALADVLTGMQEPGGRLPVTMPRRLEDMPASEHYPGRNGVAQYREGRLVGYRWYDTVGREPLFPFGFGLGYSTVEVLDADPVGPDRIRVTVRNSGPRSTKGVVQAYAQKPPTDGLSADHPAQSLVGFASVHLEPQQTLSVDVNINPRAFMRWDTTQHDWVSLNGSRTLRVGTSSRDLPISVLLS